MDGRIALLLPLGLLALAFALGWMLSLRRSEDSSRRKPNVRELGVGVVTDFFDTLGIGSFALTTSFFRGLSLVPDARIPGTMNVGHALPTVAQALIYIAVVEVDWVTLVAMISAAVVGSFIGATAVSRWPEDRIRVGMSIALLVAAALMIARWLEWLPGGDDATGLRGLPLAVGIAGNFVLGALMPLGIGLYGPCMILVALLGLSPITAFPIMMGSCAFLMPVAGARFLKERSYVPSAALGLTLGGIPGVLIAAFLVRELPLDVVRGLVIVVVLYTAFSMLRAASRSKEQRLVASELTPAGVDSSVHS